MGATRAVRTDVFEESRSALNLPFLACFLGVPVAGAVLFAGLAMTVTPDWLIVAGFWVAFLPASPAGLLYRCSPTGLRIDESGVTIGDIYSSRASKRHPTINHQAWGRYSCPWPSVYNVRVVTDRAELRNIAKSPAYYTLTNRWGARRDMSHCNIGVLTSPFMRAALVAEISPTAITGTPVRPARFFSNYATTSRLLYPKMSPTWVVPTRHPEALEEALKRYR